MSPLEVLEVPSDGGDSPVAFLDEFRIVIPRYDDIEDASNLVVFDTRIPQNRPEDFQRFGLPPRYRCHRVFVRTDCDRPLGTVIREEPFTVDPAQAIFVVELALMDESNTRVLLVVRTNALIGHTGSYIPWEEWGRGSVVVKFSSSRNMATFVHGAHVAIVARVGRYCRLYTFDLSQRGCHALPFRSGEGGINERRLALEAGRNVPLKGMPTSVGPDPGKMVFSGNGIVVYPELVSHLRFQWECGCRLTSAQGGRTGRGYRFAHLGSFIQ